MIRELPPTAGLPIRFRDLFKYPGESLEIKLARFINVPEVLITCSGTAALIIALETVKKLSLRKEVVIPAYTCPLVPLAIAHCGLTIKVCDTGLDNPDFDLKVLQTLCGPNTLALIPTHLAGIPSDIDAALSIAHGCGAYVIEDAAQSLGAAFQDRSVGTLGDIGFFSLAAGKGVTLFEGGVLTAKSPEMLEAVKVTAKNAPFNLLMEIIRTIELIGYSLFYNQFGLRYTYGRSLRSGLEKNDPIRAIGDYFTSNIPFHTVGRWRKAVGANSFEYFPDWLSKTKLLAATRIKQLNSLKRFHLLQAAETTNPTYPFFLLQAESSDLKDRVLDRLWRSGLGVSTLFVHDLHGYGYLKPYLKEGSTPNARNFASRIFSISNSPLVTEKDFQFIFDSLSRLS